MGTQPSPNLPNYIRSILTIRLLRGCGHDLGTACTTPGCPRFPIFPRTPKFSPSDASENLNWMNPPFWTRDLGVPQALRSGGTGQGLAPSFVPGTNSR